MTTSHDILNNTRKTYGEPGPWDSRRLMVWKEDSPQLHADDDQAEEIQNEMHGFMGTQVWEYAIEAGPPSVRDVVGVLIPHWGVGVLAPGVGVGLGMTDVALQVNGTVLLTTNATDLANYQPATVTVPTTIQPSQKRALHKRLHDIYSLPEEDRWPNADWPKDEAFADALQFTNRLPFPLSELPYISLANDGEVNFALTGGDIHLDLGFYGTGTYSYFARNRDGEEWFEDDLPVVKPLPEKLFALLSR